MVKGMKDWFTGKGAAGAPLRVKSRKIAIVAERLERYAEAAAMAQGGHPDCARDLIQKEGQERPKILLVAREDGFSESFVEYSLGFSKRMGYEIVALTCLPQGRSASGRPATQPFACERQLPHRGQEGKSLLANLADDAGVPIRCVVGFGSADECVAQMLHELRRVEFVLTESEPTQWENLQPPLPVFCLSNPSTR